MFARVRWGSTQHSCCFVNYFTCHVSSAYVVIFTPVKGGVKKFEARTCVKSRMESNFTTFCYTALEGNRLSARKLKGIYKLAVLGL